MCYSIYNITRSTHSLKKRLYKTIMMLHRRTDKTRRNVLHHWPKCIGKGAANKPCPYIHTQAKKKLPQIRRSESLILTPPPGSLRTARMYIQIHFMALLLPGRCGRLAYKTNEYHAFICISIYINLYIYDTPTKVPYRRPPPSHPQVLITCERVPSPATQQTSHF